MTEPYGLGAPALELIRATLRQSAGVRGAILFGSRAKGTAHAASDVDLALECVTDALEAERVASALDELPLPYRFDVKALSAISNPALLAHIERVGVRIL